jgi:hypothetical protein
MHVEPLEPPESRVTGRDRWTVMKHAPLQARGSWLERGSSGLAGDSKNPRLATVQRRPSLPKLGSFNAD